MNFRLVIVLIVLVVLVAAVLRWMVRFRAMAVGSDHVIEDELAGFERMRDEGSISEEEFQRLKKVVAIKALEEAREPEKS